MEHFGLAKSLRQAGYFEIDDHQRLVKDLKTAIYDGDLIVLSGIVGCGKTTLLWRLQEELRQEKKVHVTESLAFDVPRVSLATLKLAIFYDLAMGKDGDLTMKPEKSERRLLDLIRQRERPVALFVDDAHDLHAQTLRGLKQFMEKVAKRGNRLSVVLAGHPKLRNELVNRSTLEEIAARTTVFELEGIKGHQQHYLAWLLKQCMKPQIKPGDILVDEASTLLTERLISPLQINHYLTRALEQAYRFGESR
jgi:type II secretory pathway predicted ATPase ExeA